MNIEQLPVTTEDAKALAERYKKDIIVVIAYNVDFDILYMTSYGTPAQSTKAAQWGERVSEFLGGDLRSATWHEDCRPSDKSMADLQAQLEFLTNTLAHYEYCTVSSVEEMRIVAKQALAKLPTIKRNETSILPRVS